MDRRNGKPELQLPVLASDHWRGSDHARITLIEYGDFECPNCVRVFPIVEQLIETLGQDLRFAFRHFPLAEVHPHAERAAEAAEAAAAQGQFWRMHSALFEKQGNVANGEVVECAARIGVDVTQFLRDLAARKYLDVVREQRVIGIRYGVRGAPTFFINGERYAEAHDFASMHRALLQ